MSLELTGWPRLALNSQSYCIDFPSAGVTGVHHDDQLIVCNEQQRPAWDWLCDWHSIISPTAALSILATPS